MSSITWEIQVTEERTYWLWSVDCRPVFGRGYYNPMCVRVLFLSLTIISLLTSHFTPSLTLTVCSPPRSDTHWALHQLYSQQTTGNPFIKRFSGFTRQHHSPAGPSVPVLSPHHVLLNSKYRGAGGAGGINVKFLYIMLYQVISYMWQSVYSDCTVYSTPSGYGTM